MNGETLLKVAEFHEAFDIEIRDEPGLPGFPPGYLERYTTSMEALAEVFKELAAKQEGPIMTRLQLHIEELSELMRALCNRDIEGCLDALCDMQYVSDGTVLALGLQHVFHEAFAEVHRSNMTKLDENGRPVKSAAGRVVKSSRYEPPDLRQFFSGGTGKAT